MVGFPAQATSAISSTLAPLKPRSRNTCAAASRIRSSTLPACPRGGRPQRTAPRSARTRFRFHRSPPPCTRPFTTTGSPETPLPPLDLGADPRQSKDETEQFRFGTRLPSAGVTSGSSDHGAQESGPRPADVQGRARVRNGLGPRARRRRPKLAIRGPQARHHRLARSAARDAAGVPSARPSPPRRPSARGPPRRGRPAPAAGRARGKASEKPARAGSAGIRSWRRSA